MWCLKKQKMIKKSKLYFWLIYFIHVCACICYEYKMYMYTIWCKLSFIFLILHLVFYTRQTLQMSNCQAQFWVTMHEYLDRICTLRIRAILRKAYTR